MSGKVTNPGITEFIILHQKSALHMSKAILFFFIFLYTIHSRSQCPAAAFESLETVCINQSIELKNTSSGGNKYFWDLCSGDLDKTSSASLLTTITASNVPTGITLIKENLTWYAFVTSRGNNSIQRIEVGANLDAPITSGQITNLPNSNFTNKLNGPEAIAFIKESTNWYGVVANYGNNQLLLLSFGNSLTNNSPLTTTIQIPAGVSLVQPSDLSIQQQGTQYFLFVGNRNTTKISRLVFNNSINSDPVSGTDIIVAGSSSLRSLSVVKDCDSWYLFAASENSNKIHRLEFGTDLGIAVSSIVKSDLVLSGDALVKPMRIKMINENSNYYALISSTNKFFKIKIGPVISSNNAVVSDLGNYVNLFKQTLAGFDFVNENSAYRGFFVSSDFRELYRVNFLSECFVNVITSDSIAPEISFGNAGNFHITLTVQNSSNNIDYISKQVTVSSNTAPEINFASEGSCINTPLNFTAESVSSITEWLWSFGDGDSSSTPNPSHQYSLTGTFDVVLDVTSESGCKNKIAKTVEIFNSPEADFILPPDAPLCTNQLFAFSNITTYNENSNPSWEWLINDSAVSTSETLMYLFTDTIAYDIKLKASIPGCQDEMLKSINNLVKAPLVDFSYDGQCQEELITFTNNTEGNVSAFTWNFDDGQGSSDIHPQHTYSNSGQFNVELVASTSEGCNNSASMEITIHPQPAPNFTMALPPFSCNGTQTQFYDSTPVPPENNITSWSWNFGDPGSAGNTSSTKDPKHTFAAAGNYTVTLTAGTNHGCSNTIQKVVSISQTPSADFTYTPACKDVAVSFASVDSNVNSWNWIVGDTQFFSANPSYVFLSPGSYNVSLAVTAANGCASYMQKSITVPQPVLPAFSVTKNCLDNSTQFEDQTIAGADPIQSQLWTFNNSITATGTSAEHIFTTTGQQIVNLEVTTASGCVYNAEESITIFDAPDASFTASPETGTPPMNVTFTANVENALQYAWTIDGEEDTVTTEKFITTVLEALGDHVIDLTVTNEHYCTSTSTRVITVSNPVFDVALKTFIVSEDADGVINSILTVKNEGNVIAQNMTLLVDVAGIGLKEIIPGPVLPGNTITYIPSFNIIKGPNVIYVCAELKLDGEEDLRDNQLCSSFAGAEAAIFFAPYPNPCTGRMAVEWIAGESQTARLRIIDAMGQQKYDASYASAAGLNRVMLDLANIGTGMYFLVIDSGNVQETFRFYLSR